MVVRQRERERERETVCVVSKRDEGGWEVCTCDPGTRTRNCTYIPIQYPPSLPENTQPRSRNGSRNRSLHCRPVCLQSLLQIDKFAVACHSDRERTSKKALVKSARLPNTLRLGSKQIKIILNLHFQHEFFLVCA